MRDSFVFYRSFAEAYRGLDPEEFKEAVLTLWDYALDDVEETDDVIAKALLALAKPVIDKNNQRYENGKKGGRPKTEKQPNDNQTETEPKPNETEPEPYKDKDVDKDIKEKAPKGAKEKKHRHGDKVLLTDKEYQRLKDEYGDIETEEAIQFLDNYIKEKGYKSKEHNLSLRRWVFDAVANQKQEKARSGTKVNKFNEFEQRDNNMSDIEARMMRRVAT